MNYFQQYLSTIEKSSLRESVQISNHEFENKSRLVNDKNYINYLLLGNVQSGKTAQVLGIIASLADKDIKLFFYLTTDNTDLQEQTYDRIKAAFKDFNVLNEHEVHKFDQAIQTQKPVIVVLKKNGRILKKWHTNLNNKNYLKGYQSYIIDDEADAASLNTYKSRNSGKVSVINDTIRKIKQLTNQCFFIELTATPQAILLQDSLSDWQANIIQYFKPGDDYIGGNFIYTEPPSFVVRFVEFGGNKPDILDSEVGLKQAILTYLVTCAEFSLNKRNNCNFMIHPSHKTDVHNIFADAVQCFLNEIVFIINYGEFQEINDSLFQVWQDLRNTKPDLNHFEDIFEEVRNLIAQEVFKIIVLNSKTDKNLKIDKGFNIIIGGNVISRGLTIPRLQTVYYCRSAKQPNADTFWQHSRIFGYDRDPFLIRLFMPELVYKFFTNLNETNNSLIEQVNNSVDSYQFYYPPNISPTRANVLSRNLVLLKGGKSYFPNSPDENNFSKINSMLNDIKMFEEEIEEGLYQISNDDLLNIIEELGTFSPLDWNKEKFLSSVITLSAKRPKTKNYLLIRYDRKLSKSTGTMLSETDRKLSQKYKNDIFLTLYLIKGDKERGWDGKDFWMPNIKLPEGIIFWDAL